MPKKVDVILPVLSVLGYWVIMFGIFGGPGIILGVWRHDLSDEHGVDKSSCLGDP